MRIGDRKVGRTLVFACLWLVMKIAISALRSLLLSKGYSICLYSTSYDLAIA